MIKRLEGYLIDHKYISDLVKEHFDMFYNPQSETSVVLVNATDANKRLSDGTLRYLREASADFNDAEEAILCLAGAGHLEPVHYVVESYHG